MSNRRSFIPKPSMAEVEYDLLHRPESCTVLSRREERRIRSHEKIIHDMRTNKSVEMKIHAVKPPLHRYQSQRGGHCVLLDERRNIYLQADNYLICKYMDCDKLGDHGRQIADEQVQNVKFEEQKIQTDDTEENCFLNDDNMQLSARIKRMHIPRSVGFYVPDFQHETNVALIPSESHKELFCRKSLRNKYLPRVNNRNNESGQMKTAGTSQVSFKDVCGDGKEGNTKYKRKGQDYLMVKVNLQPFRKVRVHPEQAATGSTNESPKRGLSPVKIIALQLPRKKLKSNTLFKAKSIKDAVKQTRTRAATEHTKHSHDPLKTGHTGTMAPTSPNIKAPKEKAKNKDGKIIPLPNDSAAGIANSKSPRTIITALKEETDNRILQPGILQSALESAAPKTSKVQCSNVFSEQDALKSEVDQNVKIPTGQSRNPTEDRDPETQNVTENKPSLQCESEDKPNTLQGNQLDTTVSKVTGVSGEIDFLSHGKNTKCEIDIGGSLTSNKITEYLEGSSKEDNPDGDCLLGRDNSNKNNPINGAKDTQRSDVKSLNDGSHFDSLADKIMGLASCKNENTILQRNENDEKLEFEDPDRVKTLTTTSEQCTNCSPESRDMLPSMSLDLPLNTNEHVHTDNVPASQEVQDNKPDEINTTQEQVSEMLLKPGNMPWVSGELNDIHSEAEKEAHLIHSRVNDASHSVLKSTQPPVAGKHATTSHLLAQQGEQHNTNNNHRSSTLCTETRKKTLSLSDSSKVIIVVESLNKTINIQKYLSERTTQNQTAQNKDSSHHEGDRSSGDGSQKKKICLILPEKSNTRARKRTNRKIQ